MNDSTPLAPNERAFALTLPAVTVVLSPRGLPTASTHSPTFRSSLLAMVMAGSCFPSILMSARSVVLSAPITRAENSLLSFRCLHLSFLCATVATSEEASEWVCEEVAERVALHFHGLHL